MADEQDSFDLEIAKAGLADAFEALEATTVRYHSPGQACKHCGCEWLTAVKEDNAWRGKCENCGQYVKWIKKSEMGDVRASVTTLRRDISSSKQARILERDHGRCIFCGHSDDLQLHVFVRAQHLLSVKDGYRLGFTTDELYDDANLAAMCDACNLGWHDRSVRLSTVQIRIYLGLLRAEIDRRTEGQQGA